MKWPDGGGEGSGEYGRDGRESTISRPPAPFLHRVVRSILRRVDKCLPGQESVLVGLSASDSRANPRASGRLVRSDGPGDLALCPSEAANQRRQPEGLGQERGKGREEGRGKRPNGSGGECFGRAR